MDSRREERLQYGFASERWNSLGAYSVAGNQGCGTCHVFVAMKCRKVAEPHANDLEQYVIERHTPEALRNALRDGGFAIVSHAAAAALGLMFGEDGA